MTYYAIFDVHKLSVSGIKASNGLLKNFNGTSPYWRIKIGHGYFTTEPRGKNHTRGWPKRAVKSNLTSQPASNISATTGQILPKFYMLSKVIKPKFTGIKPNQNQFGDRLIGNPSENLESGSTQPSLFYCQNPTNNPK